MRIQISGAPVFLATIFSMLLGSGPLAFAESKAVSTTAVGLKNNDVPASDLILNGQAIDADRAADIRKAGTDLSVLNPQQSDVWNNRQETAVDQTPYSYPSDTTVLDWKSVLPLNPEGWFRGQVQGLGADGQTRLYRVVMGLNVHQALMRAALLRKLGYPVQSPRWYRQSRIRFASSADRKQFISELSLQGGLVDHKRWVLSEDESKNEVLLQDVMLEPSTIVVPTSFYMGQMNATHLKGRRVLRALLVPFVLVDIPESVNMYSPEAVQIINENIIFTHKYADAFQETSLDDIRWIAERIGRLSRDDFREIVNAAQYPSDIAAVVLEKTIARRNNLVTYAQVKKRLTAALQTLPVNLQVSVGSVQQGKVTQEKYEGYALRFTHGDPETPLKTDDVVRFIKIEMISAAIRQLTTLVNDKLEFFSQDKLMQDRAEGLRQDFMNYLRAGPTKPYVQPISTWSGPVGGAAINASRSIVTGSYFGSQSSDFSVSLVDQISAGARIGYMMGIDGIPKVFPGIGANVSVVRSYVHVRPVPSIEAADKKKWQDLYVPKFMKNLGAVLATSSAETPEARQKEMSDSLAKFLEELKENETFTVTDTLALGANVAVNIPIATLLGIDPLSYSSTIAIGANANQIVLRRTTFTREGGLIKVYLQNIQSQLAGVSLDFNFWMNIMRLSHSKKWGQAKTRAFHLDEKPADELKLRNTIGAVKAVLSSNNSELLEANFYPYQLNHKTKADIDEGKFLFWRWTNIEEWHRVKVQPPKDPDHGILDPSKYERTLFSHRILHRTGENYYSFLSDILDGLVQNSSFWKPGLLVGGGGSNPKDSFYGNARWSVTSTEAEVTKGRESNPVTTVENYWAGWDLSKQDLFKTIDQIDARVSQLGLQQQGLSLIDRNVFNDMLRLQLYEIRTTLVVYEAGMQKLRDQLLVKGGSSPSAWKRLFGGNSFSGKDAEVFAKILVPMYGRERFLAFCEERKHTGGEGGNPFPPYTIVHGESYECIMPWMIQALDLRREYPKGREAQVKWATRLMTLLERNVDLSKLVGYLGQENVFYQVKISGFRTRDENGDTADYRSSTIGTYNSKDRVGVFKDFATDYNISASEMNASYLSEGY